MKAKDYAEKYKGKITHSVDHEDFKKNIYDFYRDLIIEGKNLMDQRHCKTDAAVISIFEEINNKANKALKLIPDCAVKQNFFWHILREDFPQLPKKELS